MKNKIISTLIIIMLLLPNVVLADKNITVEINSTPLVFDVQPQIINDRTMVPMRKIFEALGAVVTWDDASKTATAKKDDTIVNISINSYTLFKNSAPIVIDTAPVIVDGRTLVPVRAIAESFNCNVDWDGASRTVIITTSETNEKQILNATEIADKNSPAVFYIEVYDANDNIIATGSGFFISPDGKAVTNYHVIEGTSSAYIMTTDEKIYEIENVLKYDKELDIAIVSIGHTDSDGNETAAFPFLELGNSNNIKAGQVVYALGSPVGFQNTISNGIISNTKQLVDSQTYIQTTAPISHGSSGGALVNEYGEVIGITSAISKNGENIGFAIPINAINSINQNNDAISYDDFAQLSDSLDLEVSDTEISIEAGKSDVVYVYAGGTENSDWSVYWDTTNEAIASCEWGDWLDEYPDICPLYIYGGEVGEAYITVTSDINAEPQSVKVTVTEPDIEFYPETTTPTYTYYSDIPLNEFDNENEIFMYEYDESIYNYIYWLFDLGYELYESDEQDFGTTYTLYDAYNNFIGITIATEYNQVWIYASPLD